MFTEESTVPSRPLSLPTFTVVASRPRLPALQGVRIFAAVHIYFFHLMLALLTLLVIASLARGH